MEVDADADATMGDSQESWLPPSSPPPLPTPGEESCNGDLEDPDPTPTMDSVLASERRQAFGRALLGAACPACQAQAPTIHGSQEEGAACVTCGWGIDMPTLDVLSRGFGLHGCVLPLSLNLWSSLTQRCL